MRRQNGTSFASSLPLRSTPRALNGCHAPFLPASRAHPSTTRVAVRRRPSACRPAPAPRVVASVEDPGLDAAPPVRAAEAVDPDGGRRSGAAKAALDGRVTAREGGFALILEDFARMRSFFQQFVKVKKAASLREVDASSDSSDDNRERIEITTERNASRSENAENDEVITFLTEPGEASKTADNDAPGVAKSRLGSEIARKFISVRGAVDRAFVSVSITAQSVMQTLATAAGGAVNNVLNASAHAFPGLKLKRAKGMINKALGLKPSQKWSLLDAFEWQSTDGGTSEAVRTLRKLKRKQRMLYIEQYIRGTGGNLVGSVWTSAMGGITAVAKLAESSTPGIVGKAHAIGTSAVQNALKSNAQETIPEVSGTESLEEGNRRSVKPRLRTTYGTTMIAQRDSTAKRWQKSKSTESAITRDASAATHTKSRKPDTAVAEEASIFSSAFSQDSQARPQSADSSGSKSQIAEEDLPHVSTKALAAGATLLGAGTLMTVTAGLSLSTAATCSALAVTAVALTEAANARFSIKAHSRAQRMFRRSKSVRRMEEFIVNAGRSVPVEKSTDVPLLQRDSEGPKAEKGLDSRATNSIEGQADGASTIDAPAYEFVSSEPAVLAIPFVGRVLKGLDSAAFTVESFTSRVRRRFVSSRKRNGSEGWVMLQSFQDKSSES